jgi:tRNA A-37 threonylcarbamoyl transferase component Bud32/predicted transport protein
MVLKKSKSKKLLCGPVDTAEPHKTYLIKLYYYPGVWQKIKYCFRHSKADKELLLAKIITEKGIPTIVPRSVQNIRKWGLPQQSAILTEKLPDCLNLEELLLKGSLPHRRLRRKIIKKYGKLARLIHDQGIYQDDFDPNNILYQKNQNGSFQLFFLDFERTRIFQNLSFKKRIHSLAKLNRMGRKLKKTDQLCFLKAYLGDNATKEDTLKWITKIQREEKKVFLHDQRKAGKECTSINRRIGFIKYKSYQGYYRKRHQSQNCYTKSDIIQLIEAIETKIPGHDISRHCLENFVDMTVQLNSRKETFQIRFFEYAGSKHWLPGISNRTQLMTSWKNDNVYLKNRTADFLPIAVLEKKITLNRYHGFLIRKH